jgi:carbonic anhydrase|mmetsp:Transcript_18722/g.25309  ORF Transcript_18722/g.25309 Transcript_18722/m.25309 type:complete len:177 (+) Transcript_18722:204-734(+)
MEVVGYNYYDFKVNSQFKSSDPTFTTYFDSEVLRKQAELQLTFADGSQSYFQPLQFHFHAPSEHTVNGKNYDLEVHFVHTVRGSDNIAGSVAQGEIPGAVIGVFFDVEEGGDYNNAFLDSLTAAIAAKADTAKVAVRTFLAGVDMTEYWSYDGSLTTPPCSEGLKWTVVKQVQPIS